MGCGKRINYSHWRSRPDQVLVLVALLSVAIPVAASAQGYLASGSYTGNGGASVAVAGLGFRPDLVIVKAVTAGPSFARTKDMPPGLAKDLGGAVALQTGRIEALDADGFTIGASSDLNSPGIEYHWVAMMSVSGSVEVGQYVGDGTVSNTVPLTNMFADGALVMSGGDQLPVFHHGDMPAWRTYDLASGGFVIGSIGYFVQDGMAVAFSPTTNSAGQDYYYVAWSTGLGVAAAGSYIGDDVPGRDLTGLNIYPEFVLIASDAKAPVVQRPRSLTGDTSLFFNQQSAQNNLIQDMWDGGFRVGDDISVNTGGKKYYWLALADSGLANNLQVSISTLNLTPSEGDSVAYLVTVANLGPDNATGVQATILLPAGLTFGSAATFGGTAYDSLSGIWDIGNIDSQFSEAMSLMVSVDAGTAGTNLSTTATLTATDLLDYDPSNDSAVADVAVLAPAGADVALALTVDDTVPEEGQTITYVITVSNNGPDEATNVQINDVLPGSLSVLSDIPSQGTYDQGTGSWSVGNVDAGETQTLTIAASVNVSTSGDTITNIATVAALDQVDPNGTNDTASVDITVAGADLQVAKFVDKTTAVVGDSVTYTILATNLGPSAATAVKIEDLLPVDLSLLSAVPGAGSYDEPTGIWNIGDMASSEFFTLDIVATVDADASGTTVYNTAVLANVAQVDANAANDSSTVAVVVGAVGGVDLQLSQVVDNVAPNVGDIVTYVLTVFDAGPGAATGIEIDDMLPAGVSFVTALANKGSYDQGTGRWLVGDLAEGFQAVLNLQAEVTATAIAAAVTNTASIVAADQVDSDTTNNSASTTITVSSADLQLANTVNNTTAAVGDTVTFTLTLDNSGPNAATGISVVDVLPVTLSFVAASASLGSFDSGSGVWDVGSLNPALSASLTLDTMILSLAAGTTTTNSASISGVDQADPDTTNNSAAAAVQVAGTDLAVTLASDVAVTLEGSDVNLTLSLVNEGVQDAAGIAVTYKLPVGLTFQSAIADQGTYLAASGLWTVGTLAQGDSTSLRVVANVDAGTAGSTIVSSATITAADPADPNPANDTTTADLIVWTGVPPNESVLWPLVGTATTVLPGATETADLLTFAFVNRTSQPDTLHSMTLTNLTEGGGTPAQMDAEWDPIRAFRNQVPVGDTGFLPTPAAGIVADGAAVFDRLDWAVAPGDTLVVTVRGGASLQARDTAHLRLGIAAGSDLGFNAPYSLVGNWPLASGQFLTVDGFAAAQAAVVPRETGLLVIGSAQNLALTVDLPGNGYLDDTLYGLSVANSGSAQPATDITRIEAWADGGDGVFDAGATDDTPLGPATYSGERWQLTGLSVPVPAAGRRFYFTVDIAETALETRDIRLGLPVGNGFAVEMFSGNDGPVDVPLENPSTLGISVTDRVILTAEWISSGVVLPGTTNVPLLQFVLTNTYLDERRLQSLTFTNTSSAIGAAPVQRDSLCQQVHLWLDTNGNGELDAAPLDTRLASGAFVGDRVVFTGLDQSLQPDVGSRLFVTADLGLTTVADGNRIMGRLESISDISIPNATIATSWPLASDAIWLVNGMTAEQVATRSVSVLTLGPGEGPILAMDLTVPANGYAADELSGITLVNDGSVSTSDIQSADLWADGGNGVFDEGTGDDISLGSLTLNGNEWTNNALSWPVPAGGLQLFASLTVSASPQDSVTVKLGLPVDGITVLSGNDGPVDHPVLGTGTLVISTSPLRSVVEFATTATDTGQAGLVRMTVQNAGSETVTDIVPSLDFASGTGLMTLGTATPGTITALAPGAWAEITWPFVSALPGEVVLEGNAQGFVNGSQVRRSIKTPTSMHRIFTPVPRLELYPTANLPFSINRGQQGLVPLTLTFKNPGDADVANARLTAIRVRFIEAVDGPDVVPFDLLDRIVISEGTNVFFDSGRDSTVAVGNDLILMFGEPVTITGSEPVTLGMRLDLRLASTVPSFLVSIENAGWLVGNDAVNLADLTIVHGDGTFPVRTGQATLVSPAMGLNVAVVVLDSMSAVQGQSEILLAEIALTQSVADDSSSAIDVGRLAFEFHGADGLPLSNPSQWLSRLSLRSAFQEHFSGPPVVDGDSLVVLQLSAPVTISGGTTLVLRLLGDLAVDSPLGRFTSLLAAADQIDARDGNMNNPVPVALTTGPAGPLVRVLGPATVLNVSGSGAMPLQVSRGTRDLAVLNLILTNPGAVGTSSVATDSLRMKFFDAARRPLDPSLYLDRLRILRDSNVLGFVVDPVAADGVVTLDVAGEQLIPGQSAAVEVRLDFKPDCPAGSIEVVLAADGVRTVDAITGLAVPATAAPGTSLPLSSGVASVVIPADELTVSGTSLMPPLLVPQVEATQVMALEFTNPAPAGSGDIAIQILTLVQGTDKAANPDLGELLETVVLRQGDRIVASTGNLAAAATGVALTPDSLVVVGAGRTVALTVEVILREDAPSGSIQLILEEGGVGAGAPGGGGVVVRVLPVSSHSFPMATQWGNIGGATLAESYANFPNPFAAGRQTTTFAFSLLQTAVVNLRIVTPHGVVVANLLQGERRAAGLYQSDVWSGLNSNGRPVRNGVYLAELDVLYGDGSRERILHKVAVVR